MHFVAAIRLAAGRLGWGDPEEARWVKVDTHWLWGTGTPPLRDRDFVN